jgi:tRNA-splicing ligase RtcB (3'-phosphate/5'-hydroxy nucleic acid ligase)
MIKLAVDMSDNRKDKKHKGRLPEGNLVELREKVLQYRIYGKENIEKGALDQMETAMHLPVAVAGALMPDAHQGYGLPIGGVLATKSNIVIPYAVGVDIACRMCMTVFDARPEMIQEEKPLLKKLIGDNTIFGVGGTNKKHIDSSVFDQEVWKEIQILRDLQNLAYSQLGTSGAGNHFVEWGILEVRKTDPKLRVPPGKYLALLSHSGSRGFGNELATYYSGLAMEMTRLPQQAKHLAWLDLNSQEGKEYWAGMNLAGDYASSNHHEIHAKVVRDFGPAILASIENHHNFAWKEHLPDGTEVIIHRKGATPAWKENIGIIPGSMVHPGYIIRGKGDAVSLNSASHGAGRIMSRSQAIRTLTRADMDKYLKDYGVDLTGGDLDECPAAYKNIDGVMAFQSDMVEVLASFTPKIVRMA